VSGAGLTLLATIVVIGVLVFVHELGHFIAAKLAGIYVHRFSLGMGAPIRWLTFQRGETEYAVSWLPLGGYVKMASRMEGGAEGALEGGAGDAQVPPDRMFEAKPVWLRMVVILAGVTMNVLFAWLLYTGILAIKGIPVTPLGRIASVDTAALTSGAAELARAAGGRIVRLDGESVTTWEDLQRRWLGSGGPTSRLELADGTELAVSLPDTAARIAAFRALRPDWPAVISGVVPARPADRAGLTVGDTILAFDGEPISQWTDLVDRIGERADQEVALLIGRAEGRRTIRVTPAPEEVADSNGVTRTVGRIGIAGDFPEARERVGLGRAMISGARVTARQGTAIIGVVKGMFSGAVPTREIGGPIAIGMMAGQSARLGAEAFLSFMALISVNLAIVNMLPIPVLDGGQFLFLLAEAVTRRPVTGRIREWLSLAGLVLIVMLMVLAFSNDIRRVLGL